MAYHRSADPVLVVESGLHRTARAVLAAGSNQIGTTDDQDIVLRDLTSTGTAFNLLNQDGRVLVQAIDTPVYFQKSKPLFPGQSKHCSSVSHFTCAGIAFSLEMPEPNRTPSITRGRPWPALYTFALIGSVMVALMIAGSLRTWSGQASATSLDTTGTAQEAPKFSHTAFKPSEPINAVLNRLRRRLAESDLESITLTAEPDGSIKAHGQVRPQETAAWHEMGRWLDNATGGRTVLVDDVQATAEPQPLSVQAVWPGKDPYVIDGNGDKRLIGSVLPTGWIINAIDRKRVLVKRGDQVIAVRF